MWRSTRWRAAAGRSRRSPVTLAVTARPCAATCAASDRRAGGQRACSSPSAATSRPASRTTRICRRRCSTRSCGRSALGAPTRRSCASCAGSRCGLAVSPAAPAARWRQRSPTSLARSSSSIGSSCPRRPGAARPTCWSACCPARAVWARSSRKASRSPTWSRRSTASCAASAAPPAAGPPTAWPRWSSRALGASGRSSPRSPSTTAPRSRSARQTGPSARGRSRPGFATWCAPGGARRRFRRRPRRRPTSIAGQGRSPTAAGASAPRWLSLPRESRCSRCPRLPSRPCSRPSARSPARRSSPSRATATPYRPSSRAGPSWSGLGSASSGSRS